MGPTPSSFNEYGQHIAATQIFDINAGKRNNLYIYTLFVTKKSCINYNHIKQGEKSK